MVWSLLKLLVKFPDFWILFVIIYDLDNIKKSINSSVSFSIYRVPSKGPKKMIFANNSYELLFGVIKSGSISQFYVFTQYIPILALKNENSSFYSIFKNAFKDCRKKN